MVPNRMINTMSGRDYVHSRRKMVERDLKSRRIVDPAVLAAMAEIPRHLFVDPALGPQAYDDNPLQIGHRQTISQPYMVGLMTEACRLTRDSRVLEIGSGSGYQTAVLARITKEVYSVERIRDLLIRARKMMERLGLRNASFKLGDGGLGWPEEAPFDAIVVTAGAPEPPAPLLEQLAPGGRLIVPVGDRNVQTLMRYTMPAQGLPRSPREEKLVGCRFVPLISAAGWPR